MSETQDFELSSLTLGAQPIVCQFLDRIGLEALLARRLAADDPRALMGAARALRLLVANLCVERRPLYGILEWAARHDPRALGLADQELELLRRSCRPRAG